MGILDEEFNLDFDISLEKEPKKIDDAAQKQTSIINTLDFSFDIPEDKIEIQKKKQASIGISSILAESERLSFNEFFRDFDKKYLSPIINDELSLFTNDIDLLQQKLLEGKRIDETEKNILFQKIDNLGNLTKDDIRIIKMDDKNFYEAISNYKVNSPQDLDNLSTILNNREHKTKYVYNMINRIFSFSVLITDIKNSVSNIEKNRHF